MSKLLINDANVLSVLLSGVKLNLINICVKKVLRACKVLIMKNMIQIADTFFFVPKLGRAASLTI